MASPSSSPTSPHSDIHWKQVFIDFLAVVFGVLLGLLLNEWRISTKQDEMVAKTLATLHSEMDVNYEETKRARDYHIQIFPEIKAVSEGRMSIADTNFRGTRPPQYQTAAYEIAVQRGLFADIPQEDAILIVKAYTRMNMLTELHTKYTEGMINRMGTMEENEAGSGKFMLSAFGDFLFGEDVTLNNIAAVLNKETVSDWYLELPKSEDTEASTPQKTADTKPE